MKTKRSVIIIAIVVLVVALVYYRYFLKTPQTNVDESSTQATNELNITPSKEVSTIATYKVPDGEDIVKFTVTLDNQGVIMGVNAEDVPKKENVNLDKFTQNLLVVIKGKKLSELNNVDKVGTSSITTDAFNKALTELKSQL